MSRAGWAGWPFMAKKPPLVVRYEAHASTNPPSKSRTTYVTQMNVGIIVTIQEDANADKIDEVVLCGPATCTGWRVRVKRDVRFVERPTLDEQDAIAQRQASMRIVGEA